MTDAPVTDQKRRTGLLGETLWLRAVLAAGVLGSYALAFLLLYPLIGARVVLLGLIPALVIGAREGLVGGIAAGLLALPLNSLLGYVVGVPFRGWAMLLEPEYVSGTVTPMIVGGALGRVRDVGRAVLAQLEDRARYEAALWAYHDAAITRVVRHDVLTGLPNRIEFREQLGRALGRQDERGAGLTLLLIDLDRFREVNDSLGHDRGDGVLQEAARRLASCVGHEELLARLGGDEFAILFEGCDETAALGRADRALSLLRRPLRLGGGDMDLDASIGIAFAPQHGSDAMTLLRRAEVAMYVAKHEAERRSVYSPGSGERDPGRLALLSELRQAIAAGRLCLHFQPKVDPRTRRVAGVEALVRWPSPDRGVVPPAVFIPLAEEAGLIRALTTWVLGEALAQCRRWNERGWDLGMAVNLSGSCLRDPKLADTILGLLEHHQVAPSSLTIEVTEHVVLSDEPRVRKALATLERAGVVLSIDDFGTGYSSLTYLKDLPVGELKIDRSFVAGMAQHGNDTVIVRSIVELGHELGMRVVAEGVEDRPTLEQLEAFGCDLVQGYYYTRPLPLEEFVAWLSGAGLACSSKERKPDRLPPPPAYLGRKAPSAVAPARA